MKKGIMINMNEKGKKKDRNIYRVVKREREYKLVKYPSNNRKLLTRWEMWEVITSKYPSLNTFHIEAPYGKWAYTLRREQLLNIILEMKLHKSRHMTKKQKEKVAYELEQRKVKKIMENL